jgi:hypothetical protein
MKISSRTPEGTPNHCAVCKKPIHIDPSLPFGDAPCPNCGCLLWFISIGDEIRFYPFEESTSLRERAIRLMADTLGVDENEVRSNPNIWNEVGTDSLDLLELVMGLDDEFG